MARLLPRGLAARKNGGGVGRGCHIAGLRERLTARLADVGVLFRMRPHVLHEAAGLL